MNALKFTIFCHLWISYCLIYFTRKPIGIIKTNLENQNYSKLQIGFLDSAFLLPYSLCQILLSNLGENKDPFYFLTTCLLAAGLSTIGLGYWSNFWSFLVMLFLNGSFQSFFWPMSIKLVSTILSDSSHLNVLLGVFGTCAFAGGTLGTIFAVYVREKYGWHWMYPIPSFIIICYAMTFIVFYLCFKHHIPPKLFSIAHPSNVDSSKSFRINPRHLLVALPVLLIQRTRESLALITQIPVLVEISFATFCLKMMRYILYMWLPLMLEKLTLFTSAQAGNISAFFEIGGVLGSVFLGFLLDRYYRKNQMCGIFYFVCVNAVAMVTFLYTASKPGVHWVAVSAALLFQGTFLGGLDNMLGSCVPLFLASSYNKRQHTQGGHLVSPSAVVGLINGLGSLGTFLEGPLVGLLLRTSKVDERGHKWERLYVLLLGLALASAVVLFKGRSGPTETIPIESQTNALST